MHSRIACILRGVPLHMPRLPFTLRRWRGPLAVWALASGAATLAGPFGTHDALVLPARAAYWSGIAAAAVALHLLFRRLDAQLPWQGRLTQDAGLDLGYALIMAGGVHLLNRALFSGWNGWGAYAYLVGIVLAISIALSVLRWLVGGSDADANPAGRDDPERAEARFLRRLPVEKRAPLVRIEAQDHYLRVVTRAGSEMLLMRMADAEAELPETLGLRVHRSHWVALAGVAGRRRTGDRPVLCMVDGAEVPVSRSLLPAARAAGLI
jgi:hypothetical protein